MGDTVEEVVNLSLHKTNRFRISKFHFNKWSKFNQKEKHTIKKINQLNKKDINIPHHRNDSDNDNNNNNNNNKVKSGWCNLRDHCLPAHFQTQRFTSRT